MRKNYVKEIFLFMVSAAVVGCILAFTIFTASRAADGKPDEPAAAAAETEQLRAAVGELQSANERLRGGLGDVDATIRWSVEEALAIGDTGQRIKFIIGQLRIVSRQLEGIEREVIYIDLETGETKQAF
jgi:hypothetical protein